MRIIQFIDTLSLGGAERMAVNISNALSENGDDVMLIVSRYLGELKSKLSPAVKLICLHKKNFIDIFAFISLIKIIRRFKPDIVHAHSTSVIWAVLAKFFSRVSFVLVFHDHNGMSEILKNSDRFTLRSFSSYIDKVIVVNTDLLSWCISNLKIDSKDILYIPNFPFLNFIVKEKKMSNVTHLLCLANLRPQKDHLTMISAFSLLINKYAVKNLKLTLAGQISDKSYYSDVLDAISRSGLSDYVEILGPVSNVESILSTADIGVLSSVSEGLPVSLLEYGLAGLPVVVTDVGHCAAVVCFGQFGKVIPPRNPSLLSSAILEYLNNPVQAIQLGSDFRNHVQENYGSGKFLNEYFKLLKS